ncbi:GntR family transcriptional regulator [Seonamhaeicola sp. S2-3]|uniref:DoxX family protein n=1 Tax=Seonamhaeicola sp. S2-3 TaxID=1936081 RepID=UPI000972E4F0|nr:DoxX family protein [Seonamhaeicola sp. S2-3]APY09780.1 GntR family transcriptional regulator [Seonamhaeicola sp. S2-3]
MKKNIDLGFLILRITVAGLMLFHGVAKLSHLDGIKNMLSSSGIPEFMAYGVFITKIIAPVLMIIGFRTRLASIIFFFGMITALFLAHSGNMFALSKTGGLQIELILLYAFGALTLFFIGSGKYAISSKHIWD